MAHFELIEQTAPNAVIKVVGVGGGGGNAVAHMVNSGVEGVEFITANTDAQAIKQCGAKTQLQLGSNVTKGLGAGANPEVGRQAALEDRETIIKALEGADMVFITAGMGGGTGTGAAPVVAQIAKELGILTVAVITKPFPFEGRRRMQTALQGIEELAKHCDSLITVPNEKLITVLGRDATMISAFKAANDVLLGAVQGIADLITRPGIINVDFADVRTVMSEMGLAMMGSGIAKGDDRAQAAAQSAVNNPLLDEVNLHGANGVLVNITAGPNFTMREFDEVGSTIEAFASEDATVVIGTVLDPNMGDEVRVTVVATGLNQARARVVVPRVEIVKEPMQWQATGTDGPFPADPVSPPGIGGLSGTLRRSSRTEPTIGTTTTALNDVGNNTSGQSYLDIPSFLRRQAD